MTAPSRSSSDAADAYWNKAILLLLLGKFEEGWKLYEWRWETAYFAPIRRDFAQPLWLGDTPIEGKTILIHFEQGLGDFIQCCRYVPMLEAMGAKVMLEVTTALASLVASVSPHCKVVIKGSPLPPFDVHCPVMSLPYAMRTRLDAVPNQIPYLSADAEVMAQWQAMLGEKQQRRIGIAWSGSPTHGNDLQRSIPLAALAPVLQLPGEFHSLQKDLRAADQAAVAGFPSLHDHRYMLHDFTDTAALIAAMDVVITVDTSVAHLAGAMGKPVWLLLPYIPDYRWMLEREDSPWYPTMRIFRQPARGDWASVVSQVVTALQNDALARAPKNDAETYLAQAAAAIAAKQFEEAIACAERATAMDSKSAKAWMALAFAQHEWGDYAAAVTSYERVLALHPNHADTYRARANPLIKLRRFDEALASLNRAIALTPQVAAIYNNRGNVLQAMGRFAEAMADYNQAIAMDAQLGDAHWNKALLLLLQGDFEQGWKLHEWRWKRQSVQQYVRVPPAPLWLGETSIAGKQLLVHPEQGLGDFIQMYRLIPTLQAMGAQVVLEVAPPLMPLIASLHPDVTLVERGGFLPPIDVHCPIMSLPLAIGMTLATIPNTVPYLATDAAKVAAWEAKLGAKTKLRVGLVWSGSATHTNDDNRSIPLASLTPLLRLPYEFHALQKEIRPSDETALASNVIHSHADDLQDFTDTAALIAAMDVVITVDTSVAHLAGSMGKPVWILLPYMPDWRWLMDRTDSPWYPTARLFRQSRIGDWASVVVQVEEALKQGIV